MITLAHWFKDNPLEIWWTTTIFTKWDSLPQKYNFSTKLTLSTYPESGIVKGRVMLSQLLQVSLNAMPLDQFKHLFSLSELSLLFIFPLFAMSFINTLLSRRFYLVHISSGTLLAKLNTRKDIEEFIFIYRQTERHKFKKVCSTFRIKDIRKHVHIKLSTFQIFE